MLSRPATRITLTVEDIIVYEHRKAIRDAEREEQMDASQATSESTVEDVDEDSITQKDLMPAQQTRAARTKAAREARIGVGGSGRA